MELNLAINFANVTITTSDANSMEVIVKADATAKTEQKAEKLFSSIKIVEGKDRVEIQILENEETSWNGKETFSITVEIRMPKNGSLKGHVSFGNVTISELKGAYSLHMSYGNLTSESLLSAFNDAHVEFGNLSVQSFGGRKGKVQYGNLNLSNVTGNARLNVEFGNLKVKSVSKGCRDIQLHCDYGNVDIDFNGLGFELDASAGYGDIDLPDNFKVTEKEDDYSSEKRKGTFGNGEISATVTVNFGNIDIHS